MPVSGSIRASLWLDRGPEPDGSYNCQPAVENHSTTRGVITACNVEVQVGDVRADLWKPHDIMLIPVFSGFKFTGSPSQLTAGRA
jgi:hypothetical protein